MACALLPLNFGATVLAAGYSLGILAGLKCRVAIFERKSPTGF
jgi:hypothetical protein